MRISLKSQVGLPCFVEEDLAFWAFVSSGLKIHVSLVRFRPEPQNPLFFFKISQDLAASLIPAILLTGGDTIRTKAPVRGLFPSVHTK